MALLSLPQTVLAFRYLWLSLDSYVCPLKFLTAALFAKLASLCLPSVSLTRPLSPLLSPCSYLQLLLGLVSSSAPPLKALEFYCSEKNAKACGYQRLCQETYRGSVSQNLISDLVRTSFAPRSDLVKIAASQNPARRGFGKALQWSAAWFAAAAVVAWAAASGQGAVFGQRTKRFVKGLEAARKKPKA